MREYSTEKVVVIQTRTTVDIKNKVEEIANKKGFSVSEYIRYLISQSIERESYSNRSGDGEQE